MTEIKVKLLNGEVREIQAERGQSLMEALRGSGVDELLALCGGMMSCSTCHVYLSEADFERASPQGDDEKDMLSMSDHLRPTSRLSCQIALSDDLLSLEVEIAPED